MQCVSTQSWKQTQGIIIHFYSYHYHKVNQKIRYYATSIQISGSGFGRIVRLISGTIRFRPDIKNCYPVHPYTQRMACFIFRNKLTSLLYVYWLSSRRLVLGFTTFTDSLTVLNTAGQFIKCRPTYSTRSPRYYLTPKSRSCHQIRVAAD